MLHKLRQIGTKILLKGLRLPSDRVKIIFLGLGLAIFVITPFSIYATNLSSDSKSNNSQSDVTDQAAIAPWVKFTNVGDSKKNAHNAADNDQYDEILQRAVNARTLKKRVTSGNIWRRIRKGFALNGYEHQRVDSELNWYAKHQNYIDRITTRATPYLHFILQEVEKRHMPTEIALLPIVESAFQPYAYSPAQAAGLWQFISATGKRYGLKMNWWYDGRRDVYQSTHAALEFLTDLYVHFDNDWLLALAAYNSGQGTVDRAIRRNLKAGKNTDFWSLRLPKETRDYVPKLLAISALIDDPSAFDIRLSIIPDEPYFERVDLDSQIDLALAAKMADMKIEELYSLNAAFNRWATAPSGPHYLLIPVDKAKEFKLNLAKINSKDHIQWAQHRVQPGETLGHIANRYKTTLGAIQKINKISDATIMVGESLIIPVAATNTRSLVDEHSTKINHTVEQGDTFWELSQKYNVSIKHIAEWNSMASDDFLIPGKTLVIWQNTNNFDVSSKKNIIKTSLTSPPKRATTRKISYRVRKGDSLAHISEKFRVSVDELVEWNSLQDDDAIQPGQYLKLYVDVTRFSGKI